MKMHYSILLYVMLAMLVVALSVGAYCLATMTHVSGFARISVTIGDDPISSSVDMGQLAPVETKPKGNRK